MHLIVLLAVAAFLCLSACSGDIYLRDGLTDGDTFYVAPHAMSDPDPATQSWISYSLTVSTCQLQSDSENPARAGSFECELMAREHLAESWQEFRLRSQPVSTDPYLDQLLAVQRASFLPEYVDHYFGKRSWEPPGDLDRPGFRKWRRKELKRHKADTRLTGHWGYAGPSRIEP